MFRETQGVEGVAKKAERERERERERDGERKKQRGRTHRPLVSSGSRDSYPRGCAGPSGGAAGRDRRLNISRVSRCLFFSFYHPPSDSERRGCKKFGNWGATKSGNNRVLDRCRWNCHFNRHFLRRVIYCFGFDECMIERMSALELI